MKNWQKIALPPTELEINTVLRCGQSFRWTLVDGVWSICMQNRVLMLKQDEHNLYFKSIGPGNEISDLELVNDYFNLDIKLGDLYTQWVERDSKFGKAHRGVRILRQDPWETVCAFICSSNNNIKRISKMVSSLCTEFGTHVHEHHYDFPLPSQLTAPNVEQRLRELGFGYRAKYIAGTAKLVASEPNLPEYFANLRKETAENAVQELMKFPGVGPKVADCISLMSLDKHSIVPLDTHMFQIATRDYKLKVKGGARGYAELQNKFRDIWGDYAGWAHSVLFAGDLPDLKQELIDLKEEIKAEREESVSKPKRVKIEN